MTLDIRTSVLDLRPFVPALRAVHQGAFRRYIRRWRDTARANASGRVLQARSGRLARSIQERVEVQGLTLRGTVSSDVPYAGIHEFGGKTRPHMIRPVRARVLHFQVSGRDVFTATVHHPGSRIPERSYIRTAGAAGLPGYEAEMLEGTARVFASLHRAPRRRI